MMSWLTVNVPVFTSIRWAQEREGAPHNAEAEPHSLPSRQTASSSRKSPESMLPPPAVGEVGGLSCQAMVRLVASASATLPAFGVPVILITVNRLKVSRSKVASHWSFTEEREWAGRTVKRFGCVGNVKEAGDGTPASRSLFWRTAVCSPQ